VDTTADASASASSAPARADIAHDALIPHAKASGQYLNSVLAKIEAGAARAAGARGAGVALRAYARKQAGCRALIDGTATRPHRTGRATARHAPRPVWRRRRPHTECAAATPSGHSEPTPTAAGEGAKSA